MVIRGRTNKEDMVRGISLGQSQREEREILSAGLVENQDT